MERTPRARAIQIPKIQSNTMLKLRKEKEYRTTVRRKGMMRVKEY
jgi:hypothetical protein